MKFGAMGMAALVCAGGLFAIPALGINKCESAGKIIYSDQPCPAGSIARPADIHTVAVDTASAEAAAKRAASDKAELNRIESERNKQAAASQKSREQALRSREREVKRCNALAQRVKWAEEDAAAASAKSSSKARAKARRLAERYESECRK